MTTHATSTTDSILDQALQQQAEDFAEKRDETRHPYPGKVVLRMISPNGDVGSPMHVLAVDLSRGGLCIRSRRMFHVGTIGAVKLARSDGTYNVLGVKVMHCRYASAMQHHTGLRFIALPPGLERAMADVVPI
jgi:hypothetical protein